MQPLRSVILAASRSATVEGMVARAWYGYLMRRLAERPADLFFFLRALASRS